MKLKNNIKDIFTLQTFTSVEIVIDNEHEICCSLLVMQLKDQKLVFEKKIISIDSYDELFQHLKKNTPVVLTLNGKGILCRKLENPVKDQGIVKQILPNASANDFLIQTHTNEKGNVFCSLARTTLVEQTIQKFKEKGLFVVDLNLGFLSITSILNLLDDGNIKLAINNFKLQIKNNQLYDFSINKYKRNEIIDEISGIEIENELLSCFSSLFQYFIAKETGVELNECKNFREEFGYYHKFKLSGYFALAAVFLILLLNYLLFDHYFNKSNQLQSELTQYTEVLTKKSELQNILNRKEETINTLGLRNNIKFSFTADQILFNMPTSIALDGFYIQPQKENRQKKLLFEEQKIVIKGKTPSATDLNKWIESIRKLNWINNATLGDYNYLNQEGVASFELIITMNKKRETANLLAVGKGVRTQGN
jgi:hypothetical protein